MLDPDGGPAGRGGWEGLTRQVVQDRGPEEFIVERMEGGTGGGDSYLCGPEVSLAGINSEDTHLTSLPLVSIPHHGHVTQEKVETTFHLKFKLHFHCVQLML